MKAFVHEGAAGLEGARYTEHTAPVPKKGEVKVKLKYAGLNHRDLFVLERHNQQDPPLILGSDGAGVIEETGPEVTRFSEGDSVIINPSLGWLTKSDAPPEGYKVLGLPDHGTFAETITISQEYLEKKPEHLTWEEAGVLALSALTAYRALFTRAKIKRTDTILLPGVGSGAVTFLLLFAKAIGARVIVTSRSEEKRRKALELGADIAIDSSGDWDKALHGEKADIAIETVGAATFNKTLSQVRKGGTLVTFGASAGDEVTLNLRSLFYGQFNLLGSTMGSRDELREMLYFINRYQIKPVIDQVFPLSQTAEAMRRLEDAEQFGKIPLEIQPT